MNKKMGKNRIIVVLIITSVLILIPLTLNWLLIIPGRGSDDGWLGFWGGYLGSIIAILYASYAARKEAEKAKIDVEEHIEEARKAEVRAYYDKAKLNKIFEIQENLVEVYDLIKKLPNMIDPPEKILDAKVEIENIEEKIEMLNSKILKLQFYFDRKDVDFSSYKKALSLVVKDELKNIIEEEAWKQNIVELSQEWYVLYKKIIPKVNEFGRNYIEKQIRNLNEIIKIGRDNIK